MIATTSTGLLAAMADAGSPRWNDFTERYEGAMRGYLAARFPGVEADDVIQETMAAVAARIKHYRYEPDEKGHFRNWLFGILRHKAIRALEKDASRERREADWEEKRRDAASPCDDDSWRVAAMEVALAELLADDSIHSQSREIFRRVAVNGEKPQAVAEAFGVTRNSVDQTKNRLTRRLKAIVERLLAP